MSDNISGALRGPSPAGANGHDLLSEMALAAVAIEASTCFPPAVLLSQWACESGWGKHVTGDYNYWGKTRAPETGPAKFCPTHEDVTVAQLAKFRPDERASETRRAPLGNGRFRVWMSRWFASYATLEDSLADYVRTFINSPQRYKAAWRQYLRSKDSDAFLIAICNSGYATSSDYQNELLAIAHQPNVQHAIAAARQQFAATPPQNKSGPEPQSSEPR